MNNTLKMQLESELRDAEERAEQAITADARAAAERDAEGYRAQLREIEERANYRLVTLTVRDMPDGPTHTPLAPAPSGGVCAHVRALRNHTPHVVRVRAPSGIDYEVAPESTPARVVQRNEDMGSLDVDGVLVAVARPTYGEVTGLPTPREGEYLIVSTMVADALRGSGRADILVPDSGPDAIREGGQIVAVRRLLWRGVL